MKAPAPVFHLLYPEPPLSKNNPITLDYFHGQQTLVVFFRSDCAPCVAERPILNAIATAHPQMRIAVISLDGDAHKERHYPTPPHSNMVILSSAGDAVSTLKALGDTRNALPFSLILRADGTPCDKHYGMMGTDMADGWMKRC